MLGEASPLIILQDSRELIIRLDKVHYFTRGSKVSLRKIGPETAKMTRNIHRIKLGYPRVLVELIVTTGKIYQRTLVTASEPQSTGDTQLAHTCTRYALYSAL